MIVMVIDSEEGTNFKSTFHERIRAGKIRSFDFVSIRGGMDTPGTIEFARGGSGNSVEAKVKCRAMGKDWRLVQSFR